MLNRKLIQSLAALIFLLNICCVSVFAQTKAIVQVNETGWSIRELKVKDAYLPGKVLAQALLDRNVVLGIVKDESLPDEAFSALLMGYNSADDLRADPSTYFLMRYGIGYTTILRIYANSIVGSSFKAGLLLRAGPSMAVINEESPSHLGGSGSYVAPLFNGTGNLYLAAIKAVVKGADLNEGGEAAAKFDALQQRGAFKKNPMLRLYANVAAFRLVSDTSLASPGEWVATTQFLNELPTFISEIAPYVKSLGEGEVADPIKVAAWLGQFNSDFAKKLLSEIIDTNSP